MVKEKQIRQIKDIRQKREERAARNLHAAENALQSLQSHLETVKVSLKHFQIWRKHQEASFYGEIGDKTVTIGDLESYREKLSKMLSQEDDILQNLDKFGAMISEAEKDTKTAAQRLKEAEHANVKIDEVIKSELESDVQKMERADDEALESFVESSPR